MIIVRMSGGLGNQMNQYAAGYSLARDHKTDLCFDLSWFDQNKYLHSGIEGLEISSVFNIRLNVLSRDIEHSLFPLTSHIPSNRLKHYTRRLFCKNHYFFEASYGFDPSFRLLGSNSYLNGYLHSDLYFNQYCSDIKDIFSFNPSLDELNLSIKSMINSSCSVAIHVREGDYKSLKHMQIDIQDYLVAAVDLVKSRIDNPSFFVFSDDFDWINGKISLPDNSVFVTNNTGIFSYLDLYLMSICKHQIISNSTFSWWAAFLNRSSSKIVTMPYPWFANKKCNLDSLYPIWAVKI